MSEGATIPNLRRETATINGVRLHYWIGGPEGGPPVLLWHGFLATAYAWRHVAPALIGAGFAVLAPDMRGYGDSDKPAGSAGYDARALAEEFRALVAAIGFGAGRPLVIAAHDMGAPPALLWAADHPGEVSALLYIEAPVMLAAVLGTMLSYDRQAMVDGSMWWWILPLAPGVPERLVVGAERAFLTWFFERATARPRVFDDATVDEYLRTFTGREGVLGAMGVYRAAFDSMDQTAPLTVQRLSTPVIAIGGSGSLGDKVGQMLSLVASDVSTETLDNCGHFVPEECPEALVRRIRALAAEPS